jgi:hypothetical protein
MLTPTESRVVAAVRIIARAGAEGITLRQFSDNWPKMRKRDQPRVRLSGLGHFLAHLVSEGVVFRTEPGQFGRYIVTPSGKTLVAEYDARIEKAQSR